ncbi:hypothetical protein Btru_054711 [Bulinus truncatus]|nr:hypothetical protein Btru_054711 [Bulinus truncatus]
MSQYQNTNFLGALSLYNLFMFYWLTCFVSALNQLTLAGVFTSYYWTFDKSRRLRHYYLLCTSFYNCFRYHIGSLAFGSFLVAFVKFLSSLVEIVEHKLSTAKNPVASFIFKCLKCCLYCQTEFLKYINQNAYIMIAMEGTNFCISAKNAMGLLIRNVLNAIVLNRVTGLLFVFSKVINVVIVGFIAVSLIDSRMPLNEDEDSSHLCYILLLSISVIGTYIIANTFLGVYEIAVDTLFLCFLYDRENNDGSEERPYFMDENLKNILKKRSFQRRFTSSNVDRKRHSE